MTLAIPCPMSLEELFEWARRSPYHLLYNARYREGFALVHDRHFVPVRIDHPIEAEGEDARRFPAMVEAARRAALQA